MEQINDCKCGKNPASEDLHTCPFKVEINEDRESECDCCDDCESNCAWEV